MSTAALKSLSVEHLRGSVRPFSIAFEAGKKLTVVYGENGTGKSTLCDAFDFLGRGTVGSLDGRGLGRSNAYWHSIGKQPIDVAVHLTTAVATCTARLGRNGVTVQPPAERPLVEVLRRTSILGLMEATPGDRYNAIGRFVNVSAVEQSEGTLRTLIREQNSSRDQAVARVDENFQAIERFWVNAGSPGADAFAWAKIEALRDPNEAAAEVQALNDLQAAYARLAGHSAQIKAAADGLAKARAAESESMANQSTVLQQVSSDAAELTALLRAAAHYLAKHRDGQVCPLCESPDKAAGLAARVSARITTFSSVQAAQTVVSQAQSSVQSSLTRLETARQNATRDIDSFKTACAAFSWSGDVEVPATQPDSADVSQLGQWLNDTAHLPANWRAALTKRQDLKQFRTTLRDALRNWQKNVDAQKELDALLPQLEKALAILQAERRTYVDGILSSIATRVGELYEAVHPGEGLNKISLDMDPNRRASLDINAEFLGKTVPPQAYFSDSHLDTLGLCVFLALAAKDQPAETILVLDDVLASVDEPHVERLIEMLYAQALDFRHCVITTHYRPWKEKLRWGWLQHGECQFIELTKWNASTGLALTRTVSEVEWLQKRLAENPPDLQGICGKAGVVLEAALDFLTVLYRCSVPRQADGKYTLGELLPAVSGKLRQALRVEVREDQPDGTRQYVSHDLGPLLDELHRIMQVRNVMGCHFNSLSFELLDADAIRFAETVLLFSTKLVDSKTGWPRNGKSGNYWETSGESRRLYPFGKPS